MTMSSKRKEPICALSHPGSGQNKVESHAHAHSCVEKAHHKLTLFGVPVCKTGMPSLFCLPQGTPWGPQRNQVLQSLLQPRASRAGTFLLSAPQLLHNTLLSCCI